MLIGMKALTYSIPHTVLDIEAATGRARKRVTKRALLSAGAAVVPVPGLDIAVDLGVMVAMIDEINAEFGLTPAQLEQLSPESKLLAYKAITVVGASLAGKLITKELVITMMKTVGVRLTAKQAARWVPVAGQAVAASISFGALKYLGNRHVEECARVASTLIDLNPPPRARN